MKKIFCRLWCKILAVILIIASVVCFYVCYSGSTFIQNDPQIFFTKECNYYNSRSFDLLAQSYANYITDKYNELSTEDFKTELENNKSKLLIFNISGTNDDKKEYFNYVKDGYIIKYRTEIVIDDKSYVTKQNEDNTKIWARLEMYFPEDPDTYTTKDSFYTSYTNYKTEFESRYLIIGGMASSVILFILCIISLIIGAGYKKGSDKIHLTWFDKIPLELIIAFPFFIIPLFCNTLYCYGYAAVVILNILILIFLIASIITFSVRIKYGKWYKTTLTYLILKLIYKGIRILPSIIKAVLFCFSYLSLNIFALSMQTSRYSNLLLLVLLIINISFCGIIFVCAYNFNVIKKAIAEIAKGNTDYKINDKNTFLDFKDVAVNINNIGLITKQLIENGIKSERLKAELITNVSHDIKTPLTSVINYTDLLKKEKIDNEKALEYIDVIDRQSTKLKKLTEDLIEASKASTGNVNVFLEKTNMVEFVTQAIGEYTEKFAQCSLQSIINTPSMPVYADIDGKLMWRVFDNLLNNVCKYAQPNTRVYIDVIQKDAQVLVSVKNISKDILNVCSDELTERFIRGDASRSTDGSGLGLSIAKSLTELQKGGLQIKIDGDLFKAELALKQIS